MNEYRCINCHKLLCKISKNEVGNNSVGFYENIDNISNDGLDNDLLPVDLEIKCSKCKKLNKIEIRTS